MRQLLILAPLWLFGLAPPVSAQTDSGYGDPAATVDAWYRTYLGRPAYDDPGSAGWVTQLYQGASPASVLSSILGSDEYFIRSGSSAAGFLQNLYRQIRGRLPTPSEQDFWLRRLYTQDRRAVAYEVLTQNPGSGIVVTPPPSVVVVPDRYREWLRGHEREWARERERHHGEHDQHHHVEHDYRRPYYAYRR